MIRIVIILFCVLLFMYLVAMVIGLIGGRIDQFPIWKTHTWLTIRIPAIVISVILVIVILVIFFSRMANKQSKADREFAQSQGWMKIQDYYEIIIGPAGAIIITWAYKTSDEFLALVDLARRMESAFD